MTEPEINPVSLAPGEGLWVETPVGGVLTFKVTAEQSNGALTAAETVAAPGEGPPLHVHPDEDELIYILEGAIRIKPADEMIDAAAGSFVFVPRGTAHTWQNVGAAPARFYFAVMPAAAQL
ncbi:MAG TPA: cupin domain-containing protein [Solirubrobacteraceae bacterium]|nr:cupin domain-containing protein [Solirubrobacteraceae bacterium]